MEVCIKDRKSSEQVMGGEKGDQRVLAETLEGE